MRKLLLSGLSLAVLLGLCLPSYAQRRTLRGGTATLPARSSTPVVRLATTSIRTNPTNVPVIVAANGTISSTFGVGGFAPLTVQQLLQPVPGFGFDFTHLAAVTRDLDIRAVIDPITQQRLAVAERLLLESGGVAPAFPFFFPSTPVVVIQQPAPVVVLQQPATQVIEQPEPAAPVTTAATPAPTAQAPLPEPGELVLVRKTGGVIFAVAFSQQADRVIYVTREGVRRSISLADLDIDATLRMNEERGTALQLSL